MLVPIQKTKPKSGGRKRQHKRRHIKGGGVKEVLSGVNNWLKSNKVISKAANAIGDVLPPQYAGIAKGVGAAAGALGYGKPRGRKVRF